MSIVAVVCHWCRMVMSAYDCMERLVGMLEVLGRNSGECRVVNIAHIDTASTAADIVRAISILRCRQRQI